MEITGRLTADATVKRVKNKAVVSFTIVINDSYKTKDGQKKEYSTFINCSYWRGEQIALYLAKSTIVTVTGRIDINTYKRKDGEFNATLVFHANHIRIIASGKSATGTKNTGETGTPETKDDLPF